MRFLVDAHLPMKLSAWLRLQGFDVIHTLDLPHGNRTTDVEIVQISVEQNRIVITKDSDFVDSLILNDMPQKLLLISTGNLHNARLLDLFALHIDKIILAFESSRFVEINHESVISHF